MTKAQRRWRENYPVNAAIFDEAGKAYAPEVVVERIARMCRVSTETVYSWRRTKPTRAPKAALALLCYELGQPIHPLARR